LTLRQDILDLLKKKAMTSSELTRRLGRDRASIRRILLSLHRKGKVKFSKKHKGAVPYVFWRIIENS
jgi:predicted transcriptional regulator